MRRGGWLIFAAALTALVFVTFLWVRAYQAQSVCEVIKTQVKRSIAATGQPGTPGYAYYQEHPDELKAARESSRDLLHKLPC